jgi:hypothetical protein
MAFVAYDLRRWRVGERASPRALLPFLQPSDSTLHFPRTKFPKKPHPLVPPNPSTYPPPVAANSANGFSSPTGLAHGCIMLSGVFYRLILWWLCQGIFGCAGFPIYRSTNLRTAATLSFSSEGSVVKLFDWSYAMTHPNTPSPPEHFLTPTCSDPFNLEAQLGRASELLRCAAATAYESGDRLKGSDRDLAFSVFHLIELARKAVDQSLAGFEAR